MSELLSRQELGLTLEALSGNAHFKLLAEHLDALTRNTFVSGDTTETYANAKVRQLVEEILDGSGYRREVESFRKQKKETENYLEGETHEHDSYSNPSDGFGQFRTVYADAFPDGR